MSDIENMDVMLGSGEYNKIERDFDQMTGFSNMLDRDENEDGHFLRGNSSQNNEIRIMPGNRDDHSFSRDLDMLTGEINLKISQEIGSLKNASNSHIESAISSAISERIIPQMQGVVEAVLNRQFEGVPSMSRRPQNTDSGQRNVEEIDMENSNSRSLVNLIEPEVDSPYMVTGVFEPQTSVPEFLTGRTHTHPTLSRQDSTININLNTTLPDRGNPPASSQDPKNRLADALVNKISPRTNHLPSGPSTQPH